MSGRRTKTWVAVFLALVLAVAVAYGAVKTVEADAAKKEINDAVQSSFSDLAQSLSGLSNALRKAEYVKTPYGRVLLTADIRREAGAAKTALEHLPVGELHLNNIAKLFSQVSDYSLALARNALSGVEMSESEQKTMASFRERAEALCETVEGLRMVYDDPAHELDELLALFEADGQGSTLLAADESVLSEVYLAYDGVYSDDVLCTDSAYLAKMAKIDASTALSVAAEALEEESERLCTDDLCENGDMACYTVMCESGGARVTVHGGKLLTLWRTYDAKDGAVSREDALLTAKEWLEEQGYDGFEEVYARVTDELVTLTLAPVENGVLLYPDTVTVSVERQRGRVVFFDASAYLCRHNSERDLVFTVSEEEARAAWEDASGLTVRRVLLAGGGRTETPCYELRMPTEDGAVLVYINAQNGREEAVALLIENEWGNYVL